MKKYLIVANGPFLSADLIRELAQGATIIALDGASDKLAKLGIMPNIIIGDFDSVEPNNVWGAHRFENIDDDTPPYAGNFGVTIVPAKNQDKTDLVKAINFCDFNEATHIAVVCATGNRMDHTLGNIRVLRAEHKENRALEIYTETQMLTFAKNETAIMRGEQGDYCGIMAFPEASFKSEGLVWGGETDYQLKFGYSDSTCNLIDKSPAKITITGEALLIHPGPLAAQKHLKEAEKSVGKIDFYRKMMEVCLALEFHLKASHTKNLQDIKHIRQFIKSKLNISKTEKPCHAIHYLNQKKEDVYRDNNVSEVLVSLSPEKLHAYSYFNKFKNRNLNNVNRAEMLDGLPEQYQKRIPKASI